MFAPSASDCTFSIPHDQRIRFYRLAQVADRWAGEAKLPTGSSRREIFAATAAALIMGVLLSWGAIYGLNRYLGPVEDAVTTGSVRR